MCRKEFDNAYTQLNDPFEQRSMFGGRKRLGRVVSDLESGVGRCPERWQQCAIIIDALNVRTAMGPSPAKHGFGQGDKVRWRGEGRTRGARGVNAHGRGTHMGKGT
jgi:hypothetical protein